jgi:hypothetical protein
MSRLAVVLLGALVLTAPLAARAQPVTSPDVAAARSGTHFLVQATTGFSCDSSMDLGYSLLLGAGGKLPGLPPRFYLLFEASRATHDRDSSRNAGTLTSSFTGTDVAGGLRILMPVAGPLRLYGDVLVGATHGEFGLARGDETPRESQRWSPLVDLAAGLDFQIHRNFSAGLRFKAHLLDPTPAWLKDQGGSASRGGEIAATLTAHF